MAEESIAEVFSEPSESVAESSEAPEAVATESKEVSEESQASTKVDEETSEPTSETEQEAQTEESEGDQKEYTANEKALYKQAKDERGKRQEANRKIEELEAKLAALEKTAEPVQRPDVFEDQEGFTQSLQSEFNTQLSRAKLDIQRSMMMEFKDDYAEVEQSVMEEIKSNPLLKAELQKADNVAKAVYDYGKKIADFNEAKGFDKEAYEAKIRADVKAELEKEYQEKLKTEVEAGSNLSPSLANARGANAREEKAVETLADLF